jgi:hypothetical protein
MEQYRHFLEYMDAYVPMLAMKDNKPVFKNAPTHLPALESSTIIDALFEARRNGIYTWSDEIEQYLEQSKIDYSVRLFLKSSPLTPVRIDSGTQSMTVLTDIISRMKPCLVIIPGGSELSALTQSFDFLKSLNIENKNMSVLFRLSSSTNRQFNEFVKNNELNSPITDNTEVVFISSKLPKPMLQSNIKFNSVINMGFGGVHYSIKEYSNFHENQIYYTECISLKGNNHGIL